MDYKREDPYQISIFCEELAAKQAPLAVNFDKGRPAALPALKLASRETCISYQDTIILGHCLIPQVLSPILAESNFIKFVVFRRRRDGIYLVIIDPVSRERSLFFSQSHSADAIRDLVPKIDAKNETGYKEKSCMVEVDDPAEAHKLCDAIELFT